MAVEGKWPTKRLGDLAEFRNGVNYNKSSFGVGVKVVGVSNFQDYTKPRYADLDQINPEGIVTERNILRDGDIVFVRSNGNRELIGRSLFIEQPPEEITHSAFTIRLRFTAPEVHPKFYAYSFRTPLIRQALTAQGGGTNINNLNQDILNDLKVPFPPLQVQRRIAGILSAYDELIENNQQRIKILEEMARSLYREWFVLFGFPGHDKVKMVPSPLGPIPQGWEVKIVEEVVERISVGQKYDQKTVSPTGTVPVLDQGKSGIIGYHDDDSGVDASEAAPVVVFANHTCYQRLIHFPFSTIQNVLPFVPSPSLPRNIYWLHWATNGLVIFNDYKGHWPEFAAKRLIVPPASDCERFGNFAAPLARQTLKLERMIENLRRTRDLLLPRLLSGEVTV